MQYVFWTPRMKGLTPALRAALARDRERYAVCTGPLVGFFRGAAQGRRSRARVRWAPTTSTSSSSSGWGRCRPSRGAVQEEMAELRDEGKCGRLGASIHDRPRAGRLATDSILDS